MSPRFLGLVRRMTTLALLSPCTLLVACGGDDAAIPPGDSGAGGADAAADDGPGSPDTGAGGDAGTKDDAAVPPGPLASRISAGAVHTCAITPGGSLACWGDNQGGQLGDGTTKTSAVPVHAGADTDWASVSAFGKLTCALKSSGARYCWGNNGSGQLGLGTTTDVHVPTSAADGTWTRIAAGGLHACGIKTGGALYCWGSNDEGELGTSDTTQVTSPKEVAAGSTWLDVSANAFHTCAVKADGSMWCWGDALQPPSYPAKVGSDTDWVTVSAGERHNCGLKRDRSIECWGTNVYGALGTGTPSAAGDSPPVRAGTAKDWLVVSAGSQETCALKTDGSLYCWGNDSTGAVGLAIDSASVLTPAPTRVGTASWSGVSAGGSSLYSMMHACGLQADGSAWCWGDGEAGQLGDGRSGYARATPSVVGTDTDWAELGSPGGVGKKTSGALWGWGPSGYATITYNGGSESFGYGDPNPAALPGLVVASFGVGETPCFIKGDGTLWCGAGICSTPKGWTGYQICPTGYAQFGTDTDWSQIAAGRFHTCAIKTSGALYCWGSNSSGELGDGTTTDRPHPTHIAAGTTWTSIAAGEAHSCGVQSSGAAYCWGDNSYGILGDGTTTGELLPHRVGTGASWASIVAGWFHTCALQADGSLWCWGEGGMVGDGTMNDAHSPLPIGTARWTLLAATYLHSCAIQTDGSLWCWGTNADGESGDPSLANIAPSPNRAGTDADWTSIGLGYFSSCGVRRPGLLSCFGMTDGSTGSPAEFAEVPVKAAL